MLSLCAPPTTYLLRIETILAKTSPAQCSMCSRIGSPSSWYKATDFNWSFGVCVCAGECVAKSLIVDAVCSRICFPKPSSGSCVKLFAYLFVSPPVSECVALRTPILRFECVYAVRWIYPDIRTAAAASDWFNANNWIIGWCSSFEDKYSLKIIRPPPLWSDRTVALTPDPPRPSDKRLHHIIFLNAKRSRNARTDASLSCSSGWWKIIQ